MSQLETLDSPNQSVIDWCAARDQTLAEKGVGGDDWSALPRTEQFARLKTVVGQTELVQVKEVAEVAAKLEYTNPSGSHYDRASLATLRLFERRGYIRAGDELRDVTSGSGGISLAMFASLLGYRARISLPDELPASRVFPMQHYGAEIVRTGPGYVQAMSDFQVSEIIALKNSPEWQLSRADDDPTVRSFFFQHKTSGERICYINHSENLVTALAHGELADELIRQAPAIPAAVVLAIGNWTTIGGIAPVLRHAWPETAIVGARPADGNDQQNFGLTLSGLTIPFRFRDPSLLSYEVDVSDIERERLREVVNVPRDTESRLGNSSLLCLTVAKAIAETQGGPVLTIAYDQAMRY